MVPRDEYYRAARARNLRRWAARLDRVSGGVDAMIPYAFAGGVALAVLGSLREGVPVIACGSALVLGSVLSCPCCSGLEGMRDRCRECAEALETEHRVRYGS